MNQESDFCEIKLRRNILKKTLTEFERETLECLRSAVKEVYDDAKKNHKTLIIGDYNGNPIKVSVYEITKERKSQKRICRIQGTTTF